MTKREEFTALLNRRVARTPSEQPVDWNTEREAWVAQVRLLYTQIEGWMQEFIQQDKAELTHGSTELVEDYLGRYAIPTLNIRVAEQHVALIPIGRIILGAYGRVDMEGVRGRVRLVLVDQDTETIKFRVTIRSERDLEPAEEPECREKTPTWKVSTPPPNIKMTVLTEELFFDVLMEVIGG